MKSQFKPVLRIAPFLALSVILSGCATSAAVSGASAGSPVVSRSVDLQLTAADYKAAVAYQPPEVLAVVAESNDRLRDMILDLHSDVALAREAEAEKLDQDPIIAARLAESRRKILSAALLYKTRDAVQVPSDLETLMRERYARERPKLRSPEGRKVAHILLNKLVGCPCEVKPLKQRVTELRAQLLAGADFAEAARKWSVDGSASTGGVLPEPIRRDGKTVLDFEEAVFALEKPGDISEPVITQFGAHLIKLLEIQPGRQLSYEEVESQLRAQIINEMRFSAMESLRGNVYPDPTQLNYDAVRTAIKELLPARSEAPAGEVPAENFPKGPQLESGTAPRMPSDSK